MTPNEREAGSMALNPASTARTAYQAMDGLLSLLEPRSVAKCLNVNDAHVYRYRRDGHVSPTLNEALMAAGYVRDSRRVARNGWLRRAVWIHEDDLPRFEAMLARRGVGSLQEFVDGEMLRRE